jgi:cytidylate kinase
MTRSVYIIGGAGTGKSTFTAELLNRLGAALGPLEDLYSKPNSRGTVITLRGHEMTNPPRWDTGLYLGCMRDEFPGTDGLDRVSYIPGEEWLATANLPDWILAEGATLAVRRFLYALDVTTDLLIVHLTTDEMVKEIRLAQRGAGQDEKFIAATATRARNLATEMSKAGVYVIDVETSEMYDWDIALDMVTSHLSIP